MRGAGALRGPGTLSRPGRRAAGRRAAGTTSRLSAPTGTLSRVRPALKSGLLPVWRDRDTLQIGIDPRRAVALTGMRGAAWLIGLLDGSRDRTQVLAAAQDRGMPPHAVERVLALLAAGGALDDFPAATLRALPPSLSSPLAAELATASLARGDSDGGASVLARRRAASVQIYGTARIGAAIADILTAAGVGRVTCPAEGGFAAGQLPQPHLAVLTERQPPELADRLMRERVPHLAASAAEAIGLVGPLVLPGETACLRCLDYTRADNDPAWPLILAQLAGRAPDPLGCDAALTAAVAAQAAAQALTFLDRAMLAYAAVNGTLELVLPAWQWRRRTWLPHRACTCASHTPT